MKQVIYAIEKNKDRLQQVRNYLGMEELCAGLAEEAAEVGHAALTYRRALDGKNYTPVSAIDAYEQLQEELADAFLYAYMLGIDMSMIAETVYKKCSRMAGRLGVEK